MYIPCLHFKQPIQKLEKSQWMVVFYFTLMVLTFAALWHYVLPFVHFQHFALPLATLFFL